MQKFTNPSAQLTPNYPSITSCTEFVSSFSEKSIDWLEIPAHWAVESDDAAAQK